MWNNKQITTEVFIKSAARGDRVCACGGGGVTSASYLISRGAISFSPFDEHYDIIIL